MRILVIGGAGYIGSAAVKRLISDGNTVIVLDSLSTGYRQAVDPKAKFYKGDIKDTTLVSEILIKEKIEAVMHFAAYSLVEESVKDPLKYFDNNVSGMISLLKAMVAQKIKYLIFSSTAAVYGRPSNNIIDETTKLNPINSYGETKKMMEDIMERTAKAYHIKYVALRYFNVAGAENQGSIGENHLPETHLIPNILRCAMNEKMSVTIFGNDYKTKDGTNIRDYVHIDDLIDAHVLALSYLMETNKSDVFNIGTAEGYSNLEILNSAKKITGKDIMYNIGPRRDGDPDSLVANSTKARKILKWIPKHENIDEIIASAWKWHSTHPKGYEYK